jgi:hypothetical protein
MYLRFYCCISVYNDSCGIYQCFCHPTICLKSEFHKQKISFYLQVDVLYCVTIFYHYQRLWSNEQPTVLQILQCGHRTVKNNVIEKIKMINVNKLSE